MTPGTDPPATAAEQPLFAHVFRARVPEIRTVLLAVESRLVPLDPDLANRVELVLAELLSNIQRHGRDRGQARVALRLFWQAPGLAVVLSDDGRAIPPACLAAPPPPAVTALPESGFGWHLVHQLVTDLHYRRREGCNILSFRVPR